MKSLMKIAGLIALIIVATGAAIHFTGNTMNVMVAVLKPHHEFDLAKKAPAPDYADPVNWAALPETQDLADLIPQGIAPRTQSAPVDVFFIHPTGYLHGDEWNSSMDLDSSTEENTKWMMANQASPFNSCCNVFAPRYREATIFAYMVGDEDLMNKSLDFAYKDVERAFDHFLDTRSEGRPFIIASHSQGTHHGSTLLQKRISGTPLRDRMVAAYLIGNDIMYSDLDEMPDIEACDGPDDLNCVIHWATYGEGGTTEKWREGTTVCTNPLSWKAEGARAPASQAKGAVASSGQFTIGSFGKDKAKGIHFGPLDTPQPGYTWAECKDGFLFVEDQAGGIFPALSDLPGKNYHGLDYPLFHMDIRENAVARVEAYLGREAGLDLTGTSSEDGGATE